MHLRLAPRQLASVTYFCCLALLSASTSLPASDALESVVGGTDFMVMHGKAKLVASFEIPY